MLVARRDQQLACRDATMLEVAHSFGQVDELHQLQLVDFVQDPHVPASGEYGLCQVRFDTSLHTSPPNPRAVLAVSSWTPEVAGDSLSRGRGSHDALDASPTRAAPWSPSRRGRSVAHQPAVDGDA